MLAILVFMLTCYAGYRAGRAAEQHEANAKTQNFARTLKLYRSSYLASGNNDAPNDPRELFAFLKSYNLDLPFVIFPAFFEKNSQMTDWEAEQTLLFAIKPTVDSPQVITVNAQYSQETSTRSMREVIESQNELPVTVITVSDPSIK